MSKLSAWPSNLVILARRALGPVLVDEHVVIVPTGAQVDLADRHHAAERREPRAHLVRAGEHVEHERGRGLEPAGVH
ncbi:MAG TPA: hypothetical protein VHU88_06340 [Sporichthyaceae bacterium]|nr:hypothetical protein [Sporichthyaceae bacterium]